MENSKLFCHCLTCILSATEVRVRKLEDKTAWAEVLRGSIFCIGLLSVGQCLASFKSVYLVEKFNFRNHSEKRKEMQLIFFFYKWLSFSLVFCGVVLLWIAFISLLVRASILGLERGENMEWYAQSAVVVLVPPLVSHLTLWRA